MRSTIQMSNDGNDPNKSNLIVQQKTQTVFTFTPSPRGLCRNVTPLGRSGGDLTPSFPGRRELSKTHRQPPPPQPSDPPPHPPAHSLSVEDGARDLLTSKRQGH